MTIGQYIWMSPDIYDHWSVHMDESVYTLVRKDFIDEIFDSTQEMNPEINELVNPEMNAEVNPEINESVNPEINALVNPEVKIEYQLYIESHSL